MIDLVLHPDFYSFLAPPKKPGKRHTKSMPMAKHGESLVNGSNLDQKFSFSSRTDTGGGVGSNGDEEGMIRNRSSNSQSHNQVHYLHTSSKCDDLYIGASLVVQ